MIIFNGHHFYSYGKNPDFVSWMCAQNRNTKYDKTISIEDQINYYFFLRCNARLSVYHKDNKVVVKSRTHNHPRVNQRRSKGELMKLIKKK